MSEKSWDTVLFDRIISVRFIWENRVNDGARRNSEDKNVVYQNDILIQGNENGGMKPDISFSATLLPGELFHEVTLTIKNYKLPYDIRKYTKMEITAGYRRQTYEDVRKDENVTRVFPIEIFYSYCMTPSPDSVTVFKGIIVSSFMDNIKHFFSKNRTYKISFYRDVTVIEYIQAILDLLNEDGYNVALKETIPEEIKQITMKTGPREDNQVGVDYVFTSVPNMFNSISSMLETSYRYLGKKGSFEVNFSEGKLIIYCTDGYFAENETVVDLDGISSAALNAGVLTVTAPWYPPLIPGDIIRVSREYIDGSDLPNVIDTDEIMGVDNKYRILTMDIDFASIGSANSMKITALPLRYVEDASSWKTEKEIEEYKKVWEIKEKEANETLSNIKEASADEVITEIYKGDDGSITKEEYKMQDGNVTQVVKGDKTQNIANTKAVDTVPLVHIHVGEVPEEVNPVFQYIKDNMNLFSGITLKKYGPLKAGYKTTTLCETLYKDFPVLDVTPLRELGLENNANAFDRMFGSSWLWPLVYAATYKTFLENKRINSDSFRVAMQDFSEYTLPINTALMILPGHSIMYPQITSWDQIKGNEFAGLYKAASELKTVQGLESAAFDSINVILANM